MFNFLKNNRKNKKNEIEKYLQKCLENEQQINMQLQNENQKLLEWISKIICEVGIYKVNNDIPFKIPIFRESKFDDNSIYETLIIPTIEITRKQGCKF